MSCELIPESFRFQPTCSVCNTASGVTHVDYEKQQITCREHCPVHGAAADHNWNGFKLNDGRQETLW